VQGNPLVSWVKTTSTTSERYIHGGGYYERTFTISSSTGISGSSTTPIEDVEIDEELATKLQGAVCFCNEVNGAASATYKQPYVTVGTDTIYLYLVFTGKIYNATYKARFFF
jgi:hypothetical protein